MKNLIKKYWFIIIPVLLAILSELMEFLVDYFFGDRDGYIARYGIGRHLTRLQILLLISVFILYSFKSKKTILINISIFIIFWIILEIGFGVAIRKSDRNISYSGGYANGYFINDLNRGYIAKPASIVNSIKIAEKDTIYNVHYTTDNYSRRVSIPVNEDSLKYYAIFFGGSITFGEGVNDNETFASWFNLYHPDYYSYNYAFCGYGPNQMLAKLQEDDIRKEIKYDSGIFIYVYIDEHIKRAAGALSVVRDWAKNTPHYTYDKYGNLIRKGSFQNGRKIKTLFFRVIGSSNIMKYFNVDIPGKLKPKHYKLTADIFKYSFAAYKEKFSNDKFYVVIFPGSENEIINYIKDTGIKIIDLSDLYTKYEYRLHKFDLHPNAQGHKIFAKELQKIIMIN
jgi:hypothetical protein